MIPEKVLRVTYSERLDVLLEVVAVEGTEICVFRIVDGTFGVEVEVRAGSRRDCCRWYWRECHRMKLDAAREAGEGER